MLQATPTSSTGEQIFVNVQASDAGFDWFGLITVLFTIAIAAPCMLRWNEVPASDPPLGLLTTAR